MQSTPASRALVARIAAHTRWSRTEDPTSATAPARAAFLDRFAREVDPDGVLPPAELTRRAEHARKAYFSRLALRSAASRRRKAEARKIDAVGPQPDTTIAEDNLTGDDAA